MTRMCKERGALRHDDRIDVVSMGIGYWVESMARDEDQSYQNHLDDLWKKEMEVHLKHLVEKPLVKKSRGYPSLGRAKKRGFMVA
jgi:hypothetical protein